MKIVRFYLYLYAWMPLWYLWNAPLGHCFCLRPTCRSLSPQGKLRLHFRPTGISTDEAGSVVKLSSTDNAEQKQEQKDKPNIWKSRRELARLVLKPSVKREIEKLAQRSSGIAPTNTDNRGLVWTSAFIAILALVLRFGGRIALLRLLGLDLFLPSQSPVDGATEVVAGASELNQQIDDFLNYFESLGNWRYAGFFGAWFAAKIFLLDPLTIVLAFSSGILFGGLWQGAAASVVCSSAASLVAFLVARYALRDKAKEEISKRPTFRAVDRACSKEGFKTVFTLRISPLLPIPIGAYNYIYGASSVSTWDFLAGITLGSIKPYLLDSYLGMFGKSVLDSQGSSEEDIFLLLFIGTVILVGTYASQIAKNTIEEIQAEAEKDAGVGGEWSRSSSTAFLGVVDYKFIPNFVQQLERETKEAWQRLDTVVENEIYASAFEERNGIDLGAESQASATIKTIDRSSSPAASEEFTNYSYPGVRTIRDFEARPLNDESTWRYLLESVLFSPLLIVLAFNEKKIAKTVEKANQEDLKSI